MKLSNTDEKLLIKAISKSGQGKVHGSSADRKRQFNSVKKLVKLGLADGYKSEFNRVSGYQIGNQWVSGSCWFENSANLTEKGRMIAMGLKND